MERHGDAANNIVHMYYKCIATPLRESGTTEVCDYLTFPYGITLISMHDDVNAASVQGIIYPMHPSL